MDYSNFIFIFVFLLPVCVAYTTRSKRIGMKMQIIVVCKHKYGTQHVYTLNHKKNVTFHFWLWLWLILADFYNFYIILIVKKF